MAEPLYYDDLAVGQKFTTATLRVNAEEIKAFARQFDPQPFHLDEAAARATMFGGLAASGWHTAGLMMRLSIDESRWLRPVRPGDALHVECEVVEMRPSGSRPTFGRVRMRNTVLAQDGVAVMSLIASLIVPRRQG
jgi:acyl dehydratase